MIMALFPVGATIPPVPLGNAGVPKVVLRARQLILVLTVLAVAAVGLIV